MNQRVEQADRSRRRLIASAAKLLTERGWARSGSAEIGEGAGMSRGAAHAHFGSKDDLLVAVWDDAIARFEYEWGRVAWPIETLDALLEAYWSLLEHDDALRRLAVALWIEARDSNSPLSERVANLSRKAREAVRSDVDRLHDAPESDRAAFASLIVATIIGSALELGGDGKPSDAKHASDLRQMLVRCAVRRP